MSNAGSAAAAFRSDSAITLGHISAASLMPLCFELSLTAKAAVCFESLRTGPHPPPACPSAAPDQGEVVIFEPESYLAQLPGMRVRETAVLAMYYAARPEHHSIKLSFEG